MPRRFTKSLPIMMHIRTTSDPNKKLRPCDAPEVLFKASSLFAHFCLWSTEWTVWSRDTLSRRRVYGAHLINASTCTSHYCFLSSRCPTSACPWPKQVLSSEVTGHWTWFRSPDLQDADLLRTMRMRVCAHFVNNFWQFGMSVPTGPWRGTHLDRPNRA